MFNTLSVIHTQKIKLDSKLKPVQLSIGVEQVYPIRSALNVYSVTIFPNRNCAKLTATVVPLGNKISICYNTGKQREQMETTKATKRNISSSNKIIKTQQVNQTTFSYVRSIRCPAKITQHFIKMDRAGHESYHTFQSHNKINSECRHSHQEDLR